MRDWYWLMLDAISPLDGAPPCESNEGTAWEYEALVNKLINSNDSIPVSSCQISSRPRVAQFANTELLRKIDT